MNANYKITEKHFKYIIISFFIIAFILVIIKPIENVNDSDGYLDMVIFRSAGYSVFLAILKAIFGPYFSIATLFLQYILGMLSIYYFIFTLKNHYKLHYGWYVLLTAILIVPYIYNQHLANAFLSEGLAYPLYLFVMAHYLSALLNLNKKKLIYGLLFLLFLIQTRWQFLILIPIGILILIWISYKTKAFRANIWLFALFFIFPLINSTVDKSFHKIVHGHYINTPWSGILTISSALYIADASDYTLFKDQKERDFFKTVFDELSKKKLNIHQLDSKVSDAYDYYHRSFNIIAIETVLAQGKSFVGKDLSENEKYIALNELTRKMTFPLIIDNFKEWFKLYLQNYIYAFGNSRYCLFYFILLFFGLFGLIKYQNQSFKLIVLLSLVTIANNALIAIGIHAIKRVTFYNDWTLFLVLFILLNAVFELRKTDTVHLKN